MLTGSIPPTGLPLPFISAGSIALFMFLGAVGVLLNIDRENKDLTYLPNKIKVVNFNK